MLQFILVGNATLRSRGTLKALTSCFQEDFSSFRLRLDGSSEEERRGYTTRLCQRLYFESLSDSMQSALDAQLFQYPIPNLFGPKRLGCGF
jgi:hypothetical protein